jgi:hypothetical protein
MNAHTVRSVLWIARIHGVLLAAAVLGKTGAMGAAIVTPMDWETENSGTIGPVSVTLANITTPFAHILTGATFSGPNYSAAPLPAGSEALEYAENSNWTATFGGPIEGLFLYLGFWRGEQTIALDPPSTYTFNHPFTILSGLQGVTKSGNTLTISESARFASGIIQFSGSLSSLSVAASIPQNQANGQFLTFAAPIPEPSSVLWCAGALPLWWSRRGGARASRQRASDCAVN